MFQQMALHQVRGFICHTKKGHLTKSEKIYLIFGNFFLLITPFPCQLQSSFHSFSTSVHGKHHLIAKHACQTLCKKWKSVIVESSGAESESFCLFLECFHDLRMTMSLQWEALTIKLRRKLNSKCQENCKSWVYFL